MAFVLNLFENLKYGIVVGNAVRIVERTVGQALKLPAFGSDVDSLLPGQSSANGLLLGERQTFHEFNDLQRNGANGETFAEMSQGVKRFAIRPKEPPSKFRAPPSAN